ncbi:M4 family metallopeptidase [Roseateles sp. BYS180W]|uniref:Neutral metalloproteinase n=1 Tax=Roseateles rivi TaxID=3299028 RepID=A0ABW7FSY6_9BURK
MQHRRVTKHSALALAAATLALSLSPLAASAQSAAKDLGLVKQGAETRARAHVEAFRGLSWNGPEQSYTVRDTHIDPDGTEHVRMDRKFKGLRVIGGDLIVSSDARGTLRAMQHTLSRAPEVETKPTVPSLRAVKHAVRANEGSSLLGTPELVVYARQDLPRLAWDVLVVGDEADGTPFERHVIVDAHTGQQLDSWNDIHTAAANGTGKTLYSGNVPLTTNSRTTGGFELKDPTRGNTYTLNMSNRTSGGGIVTDADNTWGNNATSDSASAAADAQYGTAVTWDYFKNVHGRSGIRNDGVGAYNRVHYGRSYANAFWSDSCFCMTYGDGDGRSLRPLVSLDVAGHEMTHGVTSRTAGLIYSGESGGLNEATSDIFGTMVEFHAASGTDVGDYLIGEKVMISRAYLRNMVKPSADGSSADCWYSGVGNLDVHLSSGVANHFYFLLAEGTQSSYGASPTCRSTDTRVATGSDALNGIGRAKAAAIWYRALTTKMTSNTNFAAARRATVAAAEELYGIGSTESTAVARAWTAVNVN